MNTYHLKYFLDAAKNSSVTSSAKINMVSHSAISLAINNLESELGISLIKHGRRKFELTTEGRASIEYLEQLLNHLSMVKKTLQNTHNEPIGDLIIWAPQSLIVDQLTDKIWEFKKRYSKVNLKIQTGAAYLVRQSVLNNKCQLGIAVDDQNMDNFSHKEINKGEFILVSQNKNLNLKDQYEVLTTATDKVEVIHLKSELKKIKYRFNFSTSIVSWGLIKEFCLKGYGVGYLPEYVVKKELESKKLYKLPVDIKAFKYSIKAIWNSDYTMDRNAQLFLNLLE